MHTESAFKINNFVLNVYKQPKKMDLRLRAEFSSYTGYGIHASYVVSSFQSYGRHVKTDPISSVPELLTGSRLLIAPPGTKVESYEWFYTMHETTRMPAAMYENVNRAQAVIVPSRWCYQCFNAQGITAPVYVVPVGINTDLFVPKSRPSLCVFGSAGNLLLSGHSRKNMDMLVVAFLEAFRTESDVRLRIKVQPECPVKFVEDSRIEIVRECLSESDMAAWFQSLTAYVSPSRSEAFGQMNLQAMACGVPVICCAFGGVTDYHSEEHGYSLKYALTSPTEPYYSTGLWAEPDFDSLVEQMRRVYTNRKESDAKGKLASDVAQRFAWDTVNKELETVLEMGGFWKSSLVEENSIQLASAAELEPKVEPEPEPELVLSPFTIRYSCDDITGLGQQSTLLVRELVKRNAVFTVRSTAVDEYFCKLPVEVTNNLGTEIKGNVQLTMAAICNLPEFNPQVKNVLWTMWESTLLKPEWVDALNAYDAVIVACKWNVLHFKEAGVTVPVHAIPLAIDNEYLLSTDELPSSDSFTFLAGGDPCHGGERKGIKMSMECFAEAFKNGEDVKLHVKLAPGRKMPFSEDSRIVFNNSYLTNTQLAAWYASGHAFVSAATAEGWGLMQTQAMACGRPVIGARYAGHAEYLTDLSGYLVDYQEKPATGLYAGLGNWAHLDRSSLIEQMRKAYLDFRQSKQIIKSKACREAVRRFSAENFSNRVLRVVSDLDSKAALEAKPILFEPAALPAKPVTATITPVAPFESLRRSVHKAWYHAGDLGDVIYGLPAIKEKGGGRLYLGPCSQLSPDLNPRVGITPKSFEFIAPLLRTLPYIKSVEWAEQCPMIAENLNIFRYYWHGLLTDELQRAKGAPPYSLTWMHLAACGITAWDETQAWITVKPSDLGRGRVIIHRSARYQNPLFPWSKVMQACASKIAFIGLPSEHEAWCRDFGYVEFIHVKNALDMAEIIAGSKLFIGNQSFPMALAIGLGVNIVQETRVNNAHGADCVFERHNIQYVLNEFIDLD